VGAAGLGLWRGLLGHREGREVYVGLPVKVLPEATFRTLLDEARRRTAGRAQPVVPEARRRQAEGAFAAARENVNRARATWLALPAGSPRKTAAEQADVTAMRRKDERTRRVGDNGQFTVRVPRNGRYVIAIAADKGLLEPARNPVLLLAGFARRPAGEAPDASRRDGGRRAGTLPGRVSTAALTPPDAGADRLRPTTQGGRLTSLAPDWPLTNSGQSGTTGSVHL